MYNYHWSRYLRIWGVQQVPVTIREIADKCGLPANLTGRVLNDYIEIDEQTRRRVLDAARELGFPMTRRIQGSFTRNLGVLFVDESYSGLTHPFCAAMLNAFKAEVEAHGYDITFINHNIGAHHSTFLEHCRTRNVDGVCLACVDFYSKEVEELLNSDIPCVTVDHPWKGHPCVLSDNRSGLKLLVDYAVSLGHRRIAFISGQRNSEVTEARITAFTEAMKAHDLPIPKGYLVEGRYDETDVVRALVSKLLDRLDRPTCILLPDDASYFGAQEAIREHELRIPADISVAGYDGIRLTQSLRPQLTTVRQNSEELGRRAALQLIDRLEHPGVEKFEPLTIPVNLIKGATLGWCNEW